MPITVNHSTPADDSFSASGATAWNANHSLVGVGTMAEQNANNVAITGGSISGVSGIGTVTAVTGTAPVVSSGGNTPAISMAAATGSVNGYLTATDWTTFNAKQPAGTYVTSVAATSPVTSSGGATPTIAMPAATTSVSGYLTNTDWTTFNNKLSTAVTSATAGTGMSVSASTGPVTFTNTAPDQTVVLTAGTGISTSGTYPNFTITNTSPSLGGDVVGPTGATDNAVARYDTTTGKLLQNSTVLISDSGGVSGVTTLAASTSVTTPIVQASNSAGLSLKNSAGTTQISMGAGGGDNMSINVSTNLNGTNAQIDISPTGTGHVHMKPSGTGSIEIAPVSAGIMNNMVIGGITPLAGTFTSLIATSGIGGGAF